MNSFLKLASKPKVIEMGAEYFTANIGLFWF